MIQLDFDAADAREALDEEPVEVGYSSHEGAERAEWGDDKLELVDGTHPVVYPAAGSHANKFTEALYLGSSAEAGVGCDDTRGPHLELRPDVKTIPSDARRCRCGVPVDRLRGSLGRAAAGVLQRPDGPQPEDGSGPSRSNGRRAGGNGATRCPTGGVFGTGATDFFCCAVARGSTALIQLLRNPTPRSSSSVRCWRWSSSW